MKRPLAIDLYTGLHGWAEGLIAAGWHVVGFDLHDMSKLVREPLPAEHFSLVIQDVLTLHGSQFRDAELIGGDWFSDPTSASRTSSSRSPARKIASAKIAKIPFPLAHWIGKTWFPLEREVA